MPLIGIQFETERSEAERRAAGGNGRVTEDGNYYREETVSVNMYQRLRNVAEKDPEATIVRVEL